MSYGPWYDGWTYDISSIGWKHGGDVPKDIRVRRTKGNQCVLLDFVEPNQFCVDKNAEIARLRAELAKAKRALERAGFVDKGGEEWAPPLGPSASPLLDEIDRLRSELAKASAEVQRLETAERLRSFSPPKPHQFTGSEALAPSYEASQAVAKDAPPADVLGESLRGRLCAALLDERVSPSIYGAVHELAQVVERIARQQGGGK